MIHFSTIPDPIVIGTDIQIAVTSICDHSGQEIDPTTAAFEFEFRCGNEMPYRVSNTEHSAVRDGMLYLLFEGYPFAPGRLRYTERFAVANDLFADGTQDILHHYTTDLKFIR